MPAAFSLEFRKEPVMDEGVLVGARDNCDRSALTTVAAVRAASRHAHLAAEAHASFAAVACLNLDVDFVDEHGENPPAGLLLLERKNADLPSVRAVVGELHPPRYLCEQRVILPRPTFRPGRNFRPRCRTRIDPPVTMFPS